MATLEEIERAEDSDLPIKKRVEAFYKGTDAICRFAKNLIIPVLDCQIELKDRELAITGTYYRMYAWVHSLVKMNSRIHFQGAALGARSLYELLLDIKLLSIDSDGNMIAKFHAFPKLDRFRVATKVVNYNDAHDDSDIDDSSYRELVNTPGQKHAIDQLAVKHWGTSRKTGNAIYPNHWSGLTIKDRAKKLGSKYEQLYVESYPLLSWSAHAGSSAYAGLDADVLEIYFGLSHSIAQRCFLEATEITASVMHISEAVQELDKIINNLRRTPGRLIVNELAKMIDEAGNKVGAI